MSEIVLIYGESGTGKSTAIETLPSDETFIISTLGKPLPFKGWKTKYTDENYYKTDNASCIINCLKTIANKKPKIKYIIIDDFQYLMCNEFMRRALEKSYDKFSEIGQNAWKVISEAQAIPGDLIVFFLSHSDTDQNGKVKMKTIGKMLDDKVCLEGMFTVVLNSQIVDGNYIFLTQNTGNTIAKSPKDMFKERLIPNDLMNVAEHIKKYANEDEEVINQEMVDDLKSKIEECKNTEELKLTSNLIKGLREEKKINKKERELLNIIYKKQTEKLLGL